MKNISLIFTIFVLICFYHKSSAKESEKCECDILQLSKKYGEKNSYELTNLTKQTGEVNGHPFYFSIKFEEQHDIVWWNAAASSWMLQTHDTSKATTIAEGQIDNDCPKFPNIEDWRTLPEGSNVVIKSRCLIDQNKCQVKGEFDAFEIHGL